MNNHKKIERYEEDLCSYLGVERVFLYWKGRVALYAILKSIGVGPGDEVIVQGYTCVVVANAIIYCGAEPIYVDIDLPSYCSSGAHMAEKITSKTKAVICQNTYGLSYDVHQIIELARSNGLVTIDDCTHGFGGSYNGLPAGSLCDFAFYSTQWNKPYSTGLGGIGVVNNSVYKERLDEFNNTLVEPKLTESMLLESLVHCKRLLLHDWSYNFLRSAYRMLSATNLVTGSSTPSELDSVVMDDDFVKGYSSRLAPVGSKALSQIDDVIHLRKERGAQYTDWLLEDGKEHVKKEYHKNHSFLCYPLLVHDRQQFKLMADRCSVPLGDWFVSPLHPILNDLEKWQIDTTDIPKAMFCSEHVVNLPTGISKSERVKKLLKSASANIMDADQCELA